MGADIELDISTQPGTPSYDVAPLLSVKNAKINLNSDDIDIDLKGDGFVTKIASILIPLLKSSVIPTVVSQVEDQVKQIVSQQLDDDLKKYGTQFTIPYLAGVTLDYGQMTSGPTIQDDVFTMSLNGTFFDAE